MKEFMLLESNFFSKPVIVILLLIMVGVFIVLLISYVYKKKVDEKYSRLKINKRQFFNIAQEIGLSLDQTRILLDLIIKQNIKSGYSCFTKGKLLDEILSYAFFDVENNKQLPVVEKEIYKKELFEIKRIVENNSKKNQGITSTLLIVENQKIIIFYRGLGYFYAKVIKNTQNGLIISLMSDKIKKRILKKNVYIKIYFWRKNDAGYIFNSQVIGSDDEDIKVFLISHSDSLKRSQKRKYRRVPVNIKGTINLVNSKIVKGKKKYFIDSELVYESVFLNLSTGGARIETTALGKNMNFIAINFVLLQQNISAIGKIIRYREFKSSKTEIVVQFVRIKLKERNVIDQYIYNFLP